MKHKRSVKLASVALVLLIIIGAVILLFSRLNAPHQGVIHVGTAVQPGSSIDMTPTPQDGTYATFNYPASLTVAPNNPLVTPVVEQFNFMYRDVETWNVAIAVLHNPGGSVATNNAYQYRKTKPKQYKETDETINGQPIAIMTDTSVGGFSKVAFLERGTMAATISLIGDDPDGARELVNTFDMIVSSWQWK